MLFGTFQGMSQNSTRSTVRHESHILDLVKRSLQTCRLSQNESVLLSLKARTNDSVRVKKFDCLLYILRLLIADVPNDNGKSYTQSYIKFNEAYDIYLAFSGLSEQADILKKDKDRKKQFRDMLLHPLHGLCVYIVKRYESDYVILRPDDVDISYVLNQLAVPDSEKKLRPLQEEMLSNLLSSKDTEWDKKELRYVRTY